MHNAKEGSPVRDVLPVLRTYHVDEPKIQVVNKVNILDKVYIMQDVPKVYRIGEIMALPNGLHSKFKFNSGAKLANIYSLAKIFGYSGMLAEYLNTAVVSVVAVNKQGPTKYINMNWKRAGIDYTPFKDIRLCKIPKVLLAKPWEDINLVDNNNIMLASNTESKLDVVIAFPTEARQRELLQNEI